MLVVRTIPPAELLLKRRPGVRLTSGAGGPYLATLEALPNGPNPASTATSGSGRGEIFVGRRAELARLRSLIDLAFQGAGGVALVTGEAGVGKTTLVGELLREAKLKDPSLVLCRGRCVEQYGTGEAYLPFLDALGTLLVGHGREATATLLRTYAPSWCLQLPALGVSRESRESLEHQTIGATKERMLREMGDVFEAAAHASLMIGFLEDVQWADPSSADLGRHLLNRIARQRILLILTVRPGELQAPEHPLRGFFADLRAHRLCHEIPLGPLGPEAIAELLALRFPPHRFPADLPELIQGRTDGHPFFVTSLVQLLLDRGYIAKEGDAWTLTRAPASGFHTPENVRALVRRKVESLTEADRLALQYASVMGREFLSTPLAGLLRVDETELEERLARLDRAHRLVDLLGEEELPAGGLATRYRFCHSLFQEVLYHDLVAGRRVQMHLQVGQRLVACYGEGAPRLAAPLAHHFEQGRDFPRALEYLVHSAENAGRLSAHSEAADHFKRALAMVEKLPAEQRNGWLAIIHEKQGAGHLANSRFALAEHSFEELLQVARALGKPALEGEALGGLCNALFFSGRIEETAVCAAQALHAAEGVGSRRLQVEAMLTVAQVLAEDGNLADCKMLLDEVLASAAAMGNHRARLASLTYRGVVHYWQSEYDQAEDQLAEALALATELRDGLMVLIGLQFLGLARGNRGRMSDALAALNEGMEMGRRNGDRFWLPRLASHVGWVHRELQDFDRAIGHDREGLAIAHEHAVAPAAASALLNLALDYTQAGQLDLGLETLEQLEAEHSRADWFGWFYEVRLESALAEHWLARGDPERAAGHARELLCLAEPRDAHTYIAAAHRTLFEAAHEAHDPSAALYHHDAAKNALRAHPAPLYAWRLHGAIARLSAALGDQSAAQAAYVEAANAVRKLAMGVDEPGLREVFLSSPAVQAILRGEEQV